MTVPLPNPLPKIEDCMPKRLDLYYNGGWHAPQDGEYRETIDPGKGAVITRVAFAGAKDTEAALQAADKAFTVWRATPPIERGRLLKKAAQVLRDHAIELAMLDALNIGSPIKIMAGDAYSAADHIELFAGLIPAVTGETMHLGDETFDYTLREPLGVVARIVASNHPLMFTGNKLISSCIGNGQYCCHQDPRASPAVSPSTHGADRQYLPTRSSECSFGRYRMR